jgi:hypothetical protein
MLKTKDNIISLHEHILSLKATTTAAALGQPGGRVPSPRALLLLLL